MEIRLDNFKKFSAKLPEISGELAPDAASYAAGRLFEGLNGIPNPLQLEPGQTLADGPLGLLETATLITGTSQPRELLLNWGEDIGVPPEQLKGFLSRFRSDGWPKALKLAFTSEELTDLVLSMHRTIAKIRFGEDWETE